MNDNDLKLCERYVISRKTAKRAMISNACLMKRMLLNSNLGNVVYSSGLCLPNPSIRRVDQEGNRNESPTPARVSQRLGDCVRLSGLSGVSE